MRVGVVVNRVAGGGRLVPAWPRLAAKLERQFGPLDVRTTEAPGDGTRLTLELARAGSTLIIAAGGDGTLNEVAEGLLRSGADIPVGVIPAGTGHDFTRSFGFGRDLDAAVAAICSGNRRRIDAGRVTYTTDDGRTATRHFLNVASIGASGNIVRAVNSAVVGKKRSGKALFYFHTLREMLRYRPQQVRVHLADGQSVELTTALVAIANGRFFGGGMNVTPGAALDDGLFDVLLYEAPGKLQMVSDFNRIYRGTHVDLPRVAMHRAAWIEVEPADAAPENAAVLEIDGESPGRIRARFEILPQALTLSL